MIAFERLPAMLAADRKRVRAGHGLPVELLIADATIPSTVFDALYTASILALTNVMRTLDEAARRPTGKLALTDRIWQPGVTQAEAIRGNTLSRQHFGLSGATALSWCKDERYQHLWAKIVSYMFFGRKSN